MKKSLKTRLQEKLLKLQIEELEDKQLRQLAKSIALRQGGHPPC